MIQKIKCKFGRHKWDSGWGRLNGLGVQPIRICEECWKTQILNWAEKTWTTVFYNRKTDMWSKSSG